ncbi:MAG: patatin-like phospholipase family protein [Flavobacteriaceae bacterium]|nr:patatin-like phospholipase family protein [Flavobacteriaceae bacterium]
MKALVISGGGSKGAFAGGVAQYLIEELGKQYDMFLGTSTGSLLVSNLALGKVEEIKAVYTSVNQKSIFSNCPFIIKNKKGVSNISINHFNVLKNIFKGKKSFGESGNLRILIRNTITMEDYENIKASCKEVIVTVSNLSLNTLEYKSLSDCEYEDFLDWVWISCNYPPFMSLARKNDYDYADGGLGCMVPVEEAINRGATEIDVIILETEVNYINRLPIRNPFSLITTMIEFMMDQIEHQNVKTGKLQAKNKNACVDIYYTPTVLTTNSLIFNKEKMTQWWQNGFDFAKAKNQSNRI